jgi:hypothetical protein
VKAKDVGIISRFEVKLIEAMHALLPLQFFSLEILD